MKVLLFVLGVLVVTGVVAIVFSDESKPRQKVVVFTGTSFTRAVFFEAMRHVLGRETLTEDEMYIPSYYKSTANVNCNLPGKAGVDLQVCGMPGFKVVENENFKFIYQFKTYTYTPGADSIAKQRILDALGPWTAADLLVVGSAEWGHNRYLHNVTDRYDQARQYYRETASKIPAKRRMFYNVNNYNRSTKAMEKFYRQLKDWEVFDMGPTIQKIRQNNIPSGHGFAGWGTKEVFKHILKIL